MDVFALSPFFSFCIRNLGLAEAANRLHSATVVILAQLCRSFTRPPPAGSGPFAFGASRLLEAV